MNRQYLKLEAKLFLEVFHRFSQFVYLSFLQLIFADRLQVQSKFRSGVGYPAKMANQKITLTRNKRQRKQKIARASKSSRPCVSCSPSLRMSSQLLCCCAVLVFITYDIHLQYQKRTNDFYFYKYTHIYCLLIYIIYIKTANEKRLRL